MPPDFLQQILLAYHRAFAMKMFWRSNVLLLLPVRSSVEEAPTEVEFSSISRRIFTFRYFFQRILGRFSGVFWASINSENPRCRFSRRIRGLFDRLIADSHFGCSKNPHPSRCGILPHSRISGRMPLLPSCEVNDSISRCFRGFARSRRPATDYGFRTLIFWTSNFNIFTFVHRPSHPPIACIK